MLADHGKAKTKANAKAMAKAKAMKKGKAKKKSTASAKGKAKGKAAAEKEEEGREDEEIEQEDEERVVDDEKGEKEEATEKKKKQERDALHLYVSTESARSIHMHLLSDVRMNHSVTYLNVHNLLYMMRQYCLMMGIHIWQNHDEAILPHAS